MEVRNNGIAWNEDYWKIIFNAQSGYIDVVDDENSTHVKVDLRVYFLLVPLVILFLSSWSLLHVPLVMGGGWGIGCVKGGCWGLVV